MNEKKPQDTATPTSAASGLSAVLDRLDQKDWTRSTVEEVISALWVIAAVVSFGFNFYVVGWIFAVKATSDMFTSILFSWREAIAADKRSTVK